MNNYCIILLYFLLFSCTHPGSNSKEKAELIQNMPTRDTLGVSFAISLPAGWNRVKEYTEIEKRILWSFSSYNYSVWEEHPDFAAWDGPENSDSFLSCMRLKRDRTHGIGSWFTDMIPLMKEFGATVEEKGTTVIDGIHAKWWIQSFGDGFLQQKCFMVGHNEYLYFFCFTTRYLSDERMHSFDTIIKTVSFE